MSKKFLSGNEAFAEGIRLARPEVISAYPITPQTIVVERLSEMVEDGSLTAEYVHVESEHSALQTEYESVAKVISKNVEKSFSTFNA